MKFWKKLCIFVILSLVLCMTLATVSFATDAPAGDVAAPEVETEAGGKLDMNMIPETLAERAQLALQGSVTGMVMIFAVLGLLAVIMTVSKIIFHDIPNKKKNEAQIQTSAASAPTPAPAPAVSVPVETPAPVSAATTDDGELAAVITAAIAAMIESGDYKNEFVGGFRVVSFKRANSGAWNRK